MATVGALFVMVSVNVMVGQTAIRQSDVARRVQAKQERVEELQVTVARMSSSAEIARRATTIGLVPATQNIFLAGPSASPRSATVASPAAALPAKTSTGHGGR